MRVIAVLSIIFILLFLVNLHVEKNLEFQKNLIYEVIDLKPKLSVFKLKPPVLIWDAVHMNYSDGNKYLKKGIKAKITDKEFNIVVILNKYVKKVGEDSYIHYAKFKVIDYETKTAYGIFEVSSTPKSIWYDSAIEVANWINSKI
ncbi:MAG: hypothetical protein NZ870_03275 [bacterium]|nr:hypothetical protein [bacterium]